MPVATGISEDGARICLSERPREQVMRARPQEARDAQGFFSSLLVGQETGHRETAAFAIADRKAAAVFGEDLAAER